MPTLFQQCFLLSADILIPMHLPTNLGVLTWGDFLESEASENLCHQSHYYIPPALPSIHWQSCILCHCHVNSVIFSKTDIIDSASSGYWWVARITTSLYLHCFTLSTTFLILVPSQFRSINHERVFLEPAALGPTQPPVLQPIFLSNAPVTHCPYSCIFAISILVLLLRRTSWILLDHDPFSHQYHY